MGTYLITARQPSHRSRRVRGLTTTANCFAVHWQGGPCRRATMYSSNLQQIRKAARNAQRRSESIATYPRNGFAPVPLHRLV